MRGWLVVAALLVVRPAAAGVLCSTRTGRVVVRTDCKKHDTRVTLPGPPGDAGSAAPAPVRVVDSAGKAVGFFADPENEDNATVVVFEVGTDLVSAFVGTDGFFSQGAHPPSLHLVSDCSDAPLGFSRPAPLVRGGTVYGDDVWYVGEPIEVKTPAARRFIPSSPGACPGLGDLLLADGDCCSTQFVPGESTYGPLVKAFDVPSLGLTLPLHVEP